MGGVSQYITLRNTRNKGISFGHFISLVLDRMPLRGCAIYLDCMKYHSINIGVGGVHQNITLYHRGEVGGLEEVNFVS